MGHACEGLTPLLKLTDMGSPAYCGWLHSLGLILNCIRRESELNTELMSLLLDCRYKETSCSDACSCDFPTTAYPGTVSQCKSFLQVYLSRVFHHSDKKNKTLHHLDYVFILKHFFPLLLLCWKLNATLASGHQACVWYIHTFREINK